MAEAPPVRYALPNFRLARLVGIFNVIFGAQILICGLFVGLYLVTLPLWGRLFTQVRMQAEQQFQAAKKAELAALDEREKTAKTVEEQAEIAAEKKVAAARTNPTAMQLNMMDFNKLGFGDTGTIVWSWTEMLTGLSLNAAMLASGIGLLTWKPWARTLGVWTAALKIARLLLVWGYFVVAIVPPVSRALGQMVGEMMQQQQATLGRTGGMPPTELFVRVYTVFYSLMGVGFIVAGAIYPVVVLWLLTRPGVKSACSGMFMKPKEPNQPC